ncbi:MAG: VOC family protein [Myxococcota bacterium]
MAKLGPNLRCVADNQHREAIASFYVELFGAETVRPTPELDVYSFGGSNIGVYFVADGTALTPEQHEKVGTWIEIVVEDAKAMTAALEAKGHAPLDYHDREHAYFQAPGGQVFRLAE